MQTIEFKNPRKGTKIVVCVKDLETKITWGYGLAFKLSNKKIKEMIHDIYNVLRKYESSKIKKR